MLATWRTVLVLTFAGALADTSSAAQKVVELKQIDTITSSLSKPGDPGYAVLVKAGPKIIFAKGYGIRELGKPAKIGPNTNFRLASVTKQFTAMAIMLLVHDGKLRYEDRLNDIWPDFPAYGKAITVRELLTHTSGIRDYSNLMEAEEKAHGPRWSAEKQISDAEVLELLQAQTSGEFAPGTNWEYSNSGYVVLGLMVAKASGMPYEDFLQKRIFAPTGMSHSVVYVKGKNEMTNRALGHSKEGDGFLVTDQSPTSATLGDGGVYSNLKDLAKWDDALTNHTLLSEKEMLPAWTPVSEADGSPYHWPRHEKPGKEAPPGAIEYGFGWFLDPYKAHPRQYHDGETLGFRTTIQRYVSDKFTVIVLSNRMDHSPHDLAEQIADVVFATR